jgi:uncharacterized protein YdhG (YjbR/CyaY superfamily)
MFKPTKAKTITEYLAALPTERRAQMEYLHQWIQKTVPTLKPHFPYNMIGYGSFPYLNYKKQEIHWPVVALASQKQYISLYVCCAPEGKYLAEQYATELGKVSVGKSCIRFTKLEDLNMATLKALLKMAAKKPGMESAAMKKKAAKK